MDVVESLRVALQSLLSNKVRSTLTMLGVIIGVAAVIAMLLIGTGARTMIESQIQSVGSDLLFITPGSVTQGGISLGGGSAGTLTEADAQAISDPTQVPAAVAVAPESDSFGQIIYLANNTRARLVGTNAAYLTVHSLNLADGDFITDLQDAASAAVVVLGATVATDLFGSDSAVGKPVRINNQPFIVVGVLRALGGTGFGNQDQQAIVPLTTMERRLSAGTTFRGSRGIGVITVKVASTGQIAQATSEIGTVLRRQHHIVTQDDFVIQSQQDILGVAASAANTFTIFLGGIAAISLLVGGIGIMNIMLVSVSERTREIGIRKAVGARRRDIQLQFLVEATMLSLLGGVLGVTCGFAIAQAIGHIKLGNSAIVPVVGLDSVLLATLFSAATGIFFGFYPASRAAGLNPIDALHYE